MTPMWQMYVGRFQICGKPIVALRQKNIGVKSSIHYSLSVLRPIEIVTG